MTQAVSSSRFGGHEVRDPAPMAEMNTTPLIDVMLVLLIMFIITVPMQSHQVEMDLPGGPPPLVKIERVKNELTLSAAGQLGWNGSPISDAQLVATLGEVSGYAEQPEVHFRPDAAARYERVDQILGIAARSGARHFGFAGNERYSQVF
ncbi:MAG TPA: biopolymer transporter ExbD [Sphingomicrobium sp.]